MKNKRIATLLLFVFAALAIKAQIPEKLKKGEITTTQGEVIAFKKLKKHGSDITFLLKDKSTISIPASEIQKVKGNDGNIALTGFIVGTAIGGVGGYMIGEQIKNNERELKKDPNITVEETDIGKVIRNVTILGAVTGLITGCLVKKNKTNWVRSHNNEKVGYFEWDTAVESGAGMRFVYRF